MNNGQRHTRRKAADQFWEAIPPIWHLLRAQTDKTARERFDITGGQFHVLRRIKRGKTSVSDLADARHISRPTVSRKVENLVEKGLVSRRESREDRRFVVLDLTQAGETALRVIYSSSRAWLEEQLDRLDDQELETIIKAFEALSKLSRKGNS